MNSRISRLIKIAPALGVVSVLPLLAACNERAASAPAQHERPVQVQRVDFTDTSPVREFVGVVRARHETDLGFRVAGKIISRTINVGDVVHAGDVVARLDPQDLNLQVESALAELTAASSNLADAAAEEVVTLGVHKLEPGMRVRTVNALTSDFAPTRKRKGAS